MRYICFIVKRGFHEEEIIKFDIELTTALVKISITEIYFSMFIKKHILG
ncbi:MAG: hypothetical protein BAJALOKI3v1_1120002 [Promethearchaeota archaeon]|nr:MAG: hypothetical protein BAJALOKI3v1_1120002 [Candidatus Lokiarchaeota archaeon]